MVIANILHLHIDDVQTYWQTLAMHDYLKYRLCNVKDPQWQDVVEMVVEQGNHMYHVLDESQIVCDFSLDNPSGHACMIHFSMHPGNTFKYSLHIGQFVLDELTKWQGLKTLLGLIPTPNRASRLFAAKLGFKTLGKIPYGISLFGEPESATLMIKEL